MFGPTQSYELGNSGISRYPPLFTHNKMKDFQVVEPPTDSISCLSFSPPSIAQNYLLAGSWNNQLRLWHVLDSGHTQPKALQTHQGPVLDVAWSDDGTKVFSASADKTAKMWDLNQNGIYTIAEHESPIKTINWINASNYCCVMTGSWDKTLKFWDTRTPNPVHTLQLIERCYCTDVLFPAAVIGTAGRKIVICQLDCTPSVYNITNSPLKHQTRCIAMFREDGVPTPYPAGFAVGSVGGEVGIQHLNPQKSTYNCRIDCHRMKKDGILNIYAINAIAFHPIYDKFATAGSNGKFSFWDRGRKSKLLTSEQMEQSISACCFNSSGNIFAYAVSYDWSKGHEYYDPQKPNSIFLHPCHEEMQARNF